MTAPTRHTALAARILRSHDPRGRFHTAHRTPAPKAEPIGARIRSAQIMRTASLDLGQSKADRNWSSALPGRTDPDNEYRDAMGPVKEDVGCTVRTLDYRSAPSPDRHPQRA